MWERLYLNAWRVAGGVVQPAFQTYLLIAGIRARVVAGLVLWLGIYVLRSWGAVAGFALRACGDRNAAIVRNLVA